MLRFRMTSCRTTTIALMGFVAFGAPALADSPDAKASLLPDASIVVHLSNGKTAVIPVNDQLAQKLLDDPEAKPLEAHVIVFVANHQTYMIKDHSMANGETMVAPILRNYVPVAGGG